MSGDESNESGPSTPLRRRRPRFPSQEEMKRLRQHVRGEHHKDVQQIRHASRIWLRAHWENKLSYEINWLGIPIIQPPDDMLIMQEIIYNTRPDVIVETGIAHGGSLIYYASILQLLGHGTVIGVDVDIRSHNRTLIEQHPLFQRITMIEGSSTDPAVFSQITAHIPTGARVLVVLDSDHRKAHVLKELKLYSDLVNVGSYIAVADTVMPLVAGWRHAEEHFAYDNPAAAVSEFLRDHPGFEVDIAAEKLGFSYFPGGFLKRIA